MILAQKIQSVKVVFCIVLVFLFSSTAIEATDQQEKLDSPFSVLEEDIYKSNNGEIDIINQPIIEGKLERCDSAKIRLLNYNTGKNSYVTIVVNEEYKFNEETIIALRECKKDSKDILNPLNFAFIEIKNADTVLFGGWIFSKNTSISLPKIDDQYVYLSNCNCKKAQIVKSELN